MRVFSTILALATAVTAVASAALPAKNNCGSEIGCELAQLAAKRRFPANIVRSFTNAERLRRSLPLKSPTLRRGAFASGCCAAPAVLKKFRLFYVPPSVAQALRVRQADLTRLVTMG